MSNQPPIAAATAALASPPSKVVTPSSHGPAASALALSQVVAASFASVPFRIASMIWFSMESENFRLEMNFPAFGHSPEYEHDDQAGDQCQRKQGAVFAGIEIEKTRGHERTEYGAGVIHGAVKTVDPPSRAVGGKRCEHRVARRASNPLPDAIEEPDRQHLHPRLGEGNQRPDR